MGICAALLACATARGYQESRGQLLFVSDRDGPWNIYSVDTNGENLRRLTGDFGMAMDPVWSPDGRRILFDRSGMGEIVALEVGGARGVEVIASGPDRGTPHSWNGANNALAFIRSGPDGDLDIWIRDMETGELMTTEPFSIRGDYVEAVERWRTKLRRECAESRIDYVPVMTSTPYDRALFSYLEKRKKLG